MKTPLAKLLVLTFSLALLTLSNSSRAQVQSNPNIIAYFHGNTDEAAKYPVEKLTHIIYCFLHLDGNQLKINPIDSIGIKNLVALKSRNPSLKVLVSLGGWNGCKTCPEVFATDEGRTEFAKSTLSILQKFKADGIDLDWEYPAIASSPGFPYSEKDRTNFTHLVEKLREHLGPAYVISFAAGGFNEYLQKSIEWNKVMPIVDFVNIMSYDLVNGYSETTGHLTSLYSCDFQTESTDNAVQFLLKKEISAHKIIIGSAFYARLFSDVESTDNGLFRPCKFKGYVGYKDFESHISINQGYKTYWDPIAKAPWRYNESEKTFATYDDKQSIALKCEYVITNKLGGIMFWSLNSDTYENGLLDTMFNQFYNTKK